MPKVSAGKRVSGIVNAGLQSPAFFDSGRQISPNQLPFDTLFAKLVLSETKRSRRAQSTQDAWFDETLKLITIYYLLFFRLAPTDDKWVSLPFVIPSGTRNPSRAETNNLLDMQILVFLDIGLIMDPSLGPVLSGHRAKPRWKSKGSG